METPAGGSARTHLGDAVLSGLLYLLGGVAGLVCAVIVVLNLHIVVGLDEGYAASPADVLDRSPVLALVDVGLLAAGPVVAVVLVARARARRQR